MSFRLAQLRHLVSVVFLLGTLMLVSLGSLAREAGVFASIDPPAAGFITDVSPDSDSDSDSDSGPRSMTKQPLQPPHDGDEDNRCAAEDNSFDDTLELPHDLVVHLPMIMPEYSTAPVPALAGAPLAMALRPPIA